MRHTESVTVEIVDLQVEKPEDQRDAVDAAFRELTARFGEGDGDLRIECEVETEWDEELRRHEVQSIDMTFVTVVYCPDLPAGKTDEINLKDPANAVFARLVPFVESYIHHSAEEWEEPYDDSYDEDDRD